MPAKWTITSIGGIVMSEDGIGRDLQRDQCWAFCCRKSPDGWIIGSDTEMEVCEQHGDQFAGPKWDRFVPADSDRGDQDV